MEKVEEGACELSSQEGTKKNWQFWSSEKIWSLSSPGEELIYCSTGRAVPQIYGILFSKEKEQILVSCNHMSESHCAKEKKLDPKEYLPYNSISRKL